MAQYIIILNIDDAFYREFSEQGATEEALLEQLKRDIEDQVDEYDFRQLMTCIVSSESQKNTIAFAPKKSNEENQLLRLPLAMS